MTMESGTYQLGAVAGSKDGIASVKFEVTDGATTVSDTQTLMTSYGKHTNKLWCFNTTLTISGLNDGPLDVTITATPAGTGNTSRVITYKIYNNSGGSFTPNSVWMDPAGSDSNAGTEAAPVQTLAKALTILRDARGGSGADIGGDIVYCKAGTHTALGSMSTGYPRAANTWLTIKADPSATKASVILAGTSWGTRFIDNVKYEGLTTKEQVDESGSSTYGPRRIWFDNCDHPWTDTSVERKWASTTAFDEYYYTDCSMSNQGTGYLMATMVRDSTADNLGSTFLKQCESAFNCTATTGRIVAPFHGDLISIQNSTTRNNIVFMNVRGVDWEELGFLFDKAAMTPSGDPLIQDGLFANILIQDNGKVENSSIANRNEHCLFYHITHDERFTFSAGPTAFSGTIWFHNCCFYLVDNTVSDSVVSGACTFTNIHHQQTPAPSYLASASTGDPKYTSPGAPNWDYRPATGSPLLAAGSAIPNWNLPPGSDGVGSNVATPNIGAWGDAAGAGFSGGTYAGGGGGGGSTKVAFWNWFG